MRYVRRMFWDFHRPWLRRVILLANCLLPIAVIWSRFSNLPLLGAAIVAHALLVFAIMHPRCPWLGPVVRGFRTDRRAVWLTIDDGPDGGQTLRLSEELRTRGVKATFFVIGARLVQQPEVARALIEAGHTLANHSATHPQGKMWRLGAASARAEVEGGTEALKTAGVVSPWFRSPVGHKPPGLDFVLAARGLRQIGWTAGGRDGHDGNIPDAVSRIQRKVRPGGILLLHECRAHSFETIVATVDALLARGFSFVVPADEALGEPEPARES